MSKPNEKLSAYFPGLIDVCRGEDGQLVYLVDDHGRFSLQESMGLDGEEVVPPDIENFPFEVPKAKGVMRHIKQEDKNLYADLLTYLKRFSALDAHQWAVVAHYVFLTYLHDHSEIDYCPYILFYAVPERGKSRIGKSIANVSFRGVHQIELREPNIFRYSEHLHGTLFFDLMDVWKKAERSGCEDILLLRAEKGAKCSRILYPEKGAFRDTVYYDIYGPTIIASNEQLHKILGTRCLPIVMPNRPGNYENPRPEYAQELKERLTAWRGKTLRKSLPEILPVEGISGRLWDICRPLLQIGKLVNPDGGNLLLEAILNIAGERDASKRETTEGHLVAIIQELTGQKGAERFAEWSIKVSDILRAFNENRTEDRHVTPQWIGRKLKSMSLTHRAVQGRSEILLSSQEYRTLLEQYGCGPRTSTLPNQTLPGRTPGYQLDTGIVGSCRVSVDGLEISGTDRERFLDLADALESQAGLSRRDAERLAAKKIHQEEGGDV